MTLSPAPRHSPVRRLARLAALPAIVTMVATSGAEAVPQAGDTAISATVSSNDAPAGRAAAAGTRAAAVPALRTRVVEGSLDIPWDITVLPRGAWLVTERTRKRVLIRYVDGSMRVLAAPARLWAGGETGLMSILADPKVASNSRFYTCTGWQQDGLIDIRVHAWRLNGARTSARIVDTLVSGIQVTSGRHGGCRLRLDRLGRLYVGTGDAAVGTNPQNLRSLNGKVLRLNRFTGNAAADNPFIGANVRRKRLVYTYGHRNVQGLALRPGRRMWSVEHGTYRDDEVNVLFRGGNYGWNPVPGYDESKPMTNFSLPGKQYAARWSSGDPTIATSGAVWVRGQQWGRYRGALAVCALAGERLVFMKFDDHGRLLWTRTPPALRGSYGRLRSVVQTADHDLLITTANGGGVDKIVRVSPVRG